MKTRSGFVSNSSSSSFIVGFFKKPRNAEYIQKAMFPDGREHITNDYQDTVLHADEVARLVFKDIQGGRVIKTFDEFLEAIKVGWFEGYPEYNHDPNSPEIVFEREFKEKYGKEIQSCLETHPKENEKWHSLLKKEWDEHERATDAAAVKYAKRVYPLFKKCKFIVQLSYGDHDTTGSIMEHGNAWDSITHLKISCH